jgi:hypothetical protein
MREKHLFGLNSCEINNTSIKSITSERGYTLLRVVDVGWERSKPIAIV